MGCAEQRGDGQFRRPEPVHVDHVHPHDLGELDDHRGPGVEDPTCDALAGRALHLLRVDRLDVPRAGDLHRVEHQRARAGACPRAGEGPRDSAEGACEIAPGLLRRGGQPGEGEGDDPRNAGRAEQEIFRVPDVRPYVQVHPGGRDTHEIGGVRVMGKQVQGNRRSRRVFHAAGAQSGDDADVRPCGHAHAVVQHDDHPAAGPGDVGGNHSHRIPKDADRRAGFHQRKAGR
mmetsp:Transcript_88317/g.270276  ORF Transcript_88317/g.270276 Transcript_88317/m.270276 type:complete len:231 (+) Transcript_88317:943-1635(+)